ncbi:hypothetical protein COCVIDRAFT_99077, partial [Bipolaris victoriae FI3]
PTHPHTHTSTHPSIHPYTPTHSLSSTSACQGTATLGLLGDQPTTHQRSFFPTTQDPLCRPTKERARPRRDPESALAIPPCCCYTIAAVTAAIAAPRPTPPQAILTRRRLSAARVCVPSSNRATAAATASPSSIPPLPFLGQTSASR